MIVTDVKWKRSDGVMINGFYMDRYLVNNLDGLPKYINKAYDCVGIISGHGKVRIGKSTMAQQVGFYIAWMMAGGKMIIDPKTNQIVKIVSPKREVKFNLKDNIVFSPKELVEKAGKLPRNSVIIYDEGRAGLESARAMEQVNKGMQDFFQECGQYGHIILIVLPNFFRLHEDYAVARSLFLIDVWADKNFNRGYFSFYNEVQKEKLYFFGRDKRGILAKYQSAKENFWGKFTAWSPIDKDEYDKKKKKALEDKQLSRRNDKWVKQRNFFLYLLHTYAKMQWTKIANAYNDYSGEDTTPEMFQHAIDKIMDDAETKARIDEWILSKL